jgi:hypothetical protein
MPPDLKALLCASAGMFVKGSNSLFDAGPTGGNNRRDRPWQSWPAGRAFQHS